MKFNRQITVIFYLLFVSIYSHPTEAAETLVISVVQKAPQADAIVSTLTQAYSQLGIRVQTKTLSGGRALALSNSGIIDGEAFRIANIESIYPNLVRVDVPVYTKPIHVFVAKGKEFPVKGWESFPDNYVIGYQRGIVLIEKALTEYNLQGQTSDDLTTMLRKLNAGRIDAIVSYKARAQLIRELNLNNIVMLEPELMNLSLYHYLHKDHAHIVPELTQILIEMKESDKEEGLQKKGGDR